MSTASGPVAVDISLSGPQMDRTTNPHSGYCIHDLNGHLSANQKGLWFVAVEPGPIKNHCSNQITLEDAFLLGVLAVFSVMVSSVSSAICLHSHIKTWLT